MDKQQPCANKIDKSCSNCHHRSICYIFWDRYYPTKEKMQEKLQFDTQFLLDEDLSDLIKSKLANKCKSYEVEKND